ncbi:mitochondrial PGP phosphatase-domain-containing protein [Thermoascus aurantiacus ATCC 26904]
MSTRRNTSLQAFNLAVWTFLRNPSHLLPHLTIPTFLQLPEQLGPHLYQSQSQQQQQQQDGTPKDPKQQYPTIRALVLDKDNTLCPPKTTDLPGPYLEKLRALRTSPTSPFHKDTAPDSVLIVSNRAGSDPNRPAYEAEARDLEAQLADLRVPVFRLPPGAAGKKPFCGPEVLAWFRERGVVERADEIAVVGDRLGTDVLMAVGMGAWSVWCKDGVTEGAGRDAGRQGVDYRGFLARMEIAVERYLRETKGLKPPVPKGWEGR